MISAYLLFDWSAGGVLTNPTTRLKVYASSGVNIKLKGSAMPRLALLASRASLVLGAGVKSFTLGASPESSRTIQAATPLSIKRKASPLMSITSSIAFFRGEDMTIDFTMAPVSDITGWAITFKVANRLGGTVLITKTAAITDGPGGKFRVSIAFADTASLAVGDYVWDCRRMDAGLKATLADGTLTLEQEVTA